MTPAPQRSCGPCHLCCKVYPIDEIDKRGVDWCARLGIGAGCTAYETRPHTCRAFFCLWMRDASLGDEWRPDIAGFVLSDPAPWHVLASVDPARPDAWRRAPYEPALREWGARAMTRASFVGVREGDSILLLTPQGDIVIEAESGP
jgi:hypothetical protein